MKTTVKVTAGILFCILSNGVFSQTLEEIVSKHIEAIGGKDSWEKVRTMRYESVMKAQGAEIHFTVVKSDRIALRSDISVMGMKGFNIVTTKEGWSYAPWAGQTKSEAMTADNVKNSQDELNIKDEFLTYKELGKTIEYFDMDDIDGTECFKIKMTNKDGKETTYYIDPGNYLTIKKTEKIKSDGQETENSTFYSNYKMLAEGLNIPMMTTSGWSEMETLKLEINPKIDDAIFKPGK
ncbi:MAG: hypothetical protein PSX36_05440 [bacterium]|nr:hypothetical protein [bacterium]